MHFQLTPIAFVISSSMLLGGMSHAAIQGNGENGSSSPSLPSLIGSAEYGAQGIQGVDADGKPGLPVTNASIHISGSADNSMIFTGSPGGRADDRALSGGWTGGIGGASVIGGMSTGGSGGSTDQNSVHGGNGGEVHGSTIELNHVTLDGTNATGGDSYNPRQGFSGSGGAGGHGGGSVFGGLSFGSAAGYSSPSPSSPSPFSPSANGGNGAAVGSNTITLTNATLIGAAGGSSGFLGGMTWGLIGGGAAGNGGGPYSAASPLVAQVE